MAKEVKVFDVTAGTTATTVYTVPAGRVAKVILERYSITSSVRSTSTGGIVSGSFLIGSTAMPVGIFNGTDIAPTPVASTESALFGNIPVLVGSSYDYSIAYTLRGFTTRILFLPAGTTITMTSASARFCVIEEF